MNINIPISEILAEVRKTTQYIGTHTHMQTKEGMSGNVYESVGAIEENEEILLRFLCESVTEIRSKAVKVSGDNVQVPEDNTIEQNVRAYLIYMTVYKWLMLGNVVDAQRALVWLQQAKAALSNARNLLATADTAGMMGDEGTAGSNDIGGNMPQQLAGCNVVEITEAIASGTVAGTAGTEAGTGGNTSAGGSATGGEQETEGGNNSGSVSEAII